MRPLWFYNLFVSFTTCFDWIIDIVVLIELATWENDAHYIYFAISLTIILISRIVAPFFALRYYDYKDTNCNKKCVSILLSFFLSPILQFYHTTIDDKISDSLLHWKLSKGQEWRKNIHFTTFQTYTNKTLQLNSINAAPHGLLQSLPMMILMQIILLFEELEYDENEFVWLNFFISLATLMSLTPIYCNSFYYWQLNGSDHYDLWTFLFVPFAFCCDLLFFHYIISFLVFYDVILPDMSFSFETEPNWKIIQSFWFFVLFYVFIVISIIILVVFASLIIWLIYNIIFTDDLQCNIALCLYFFVGVIVCIFIVPIFIFIICFCLIFFNMIWWIKLTQVMVQKWPLPKVELWQQIMCWLKKYQNINDLKLRLLCVNYHILADRRDFIQKEVDLFSDSYSFKRIRRVCNVESDKFPLWHLFEWGGVIIDRITFVLLISLGPIYLLTRLCLSVLPIIGFCLSMELNYHLFEHSLVAISLIYIICFTATIMLLPMVGFHFYVLYHIAPGLYNLDCHGLFYSYLPAKDKICAIRMSYNNVLDNGNVNWNVLLDKYFQKQRVVEVIILYLGGSLFVDYSVINVPGDCQPLTQPQDDGNQETQQLNEMERELHTVTPCYVD